MVSLMISQGRWCLASLYRKQECHLLVFCWCSAWIPVLINTQLATLSTTYAQSMIESDYMPTRPAFMGVLCCNKCSVCHVCCSYLERQAFLQRTDFRQFEIERNLRLGSSSTLPPASKRWYLYCGCLLQQLLEWQQVKVLTVFGSADGKRDTDVNVLHLM